MENTPTLRSLVAGGRSSGTGRPTSPTPSARDSSNNARRGAEFEREVERARAEEPQLRGEDRRQRAESTHGQDAQAPTRHSAVDERQARASSEASATGAATEAEPATPVLPSEMDSAAEPAPTQGALAPESFHAPKLTVAAATNVQQGVESAPTSLDDLLPPQPENYTEPSLSTPGALSALASDAASTTNAATAISAGAAWDEQTGSGALAELDAAPEFDVTALGATDANVGGDSEVPGLSAQSAAPSVDATPGADAQRAPAAPETVARTSEAAQSGAAEAPPEQPRAPLDSERAAEVLRQVRLRFSPELRQAVIQLEPRELGRISIKISVVRGVVRTELRAENASALEALERHAPELQAALERVGLGGGSFALQLGFDGSPSQHASDGEQQRAQQGAVQPAERPELEGAPRALAQRLAALSGVDTYA